MGTGVELRKQIINLNGIPSDIEYIGYSMEFSYEMSGEPDSKGYARITGLSNSASGQYYTHEFSYTGRLVYITNNVDNKKYLIPPCYKRGYDCACYGMSVFDMNVLVDDVKHKVYLIPMYRPYPDLTGKQFTLHLED